MAPEFLQGEPSSFPLDVYAYGTIVYRAFSNGQLLNGRLSAKYELGGVIILGERLPKTPEIPENWWRLIEACWAPKPTDRPTFNDILEDLVADDTFVVEGTDMAQYREYQVRMTDLSAWGKRFSRKPGPSRSKE